MSHEIKSRVRRELRRDRVGDLLASLTVGWDGLLVDFLKLQHGSWGAYRSLADELPLQEVLEKSSHLMWAFPRVTEERLQYHYLDDRGWVSGRFGLEPHQESSSVPQEELVGILVPGLAMDRDGFRLGRGGGYYDRFLGSFKGLKIGLIPSCRLLDEVPTEAHDCRLDAVVTELELIWVNRSEVTSGPEGV